MAKMVRALIVRADDAKPVLDTRLEGDLQALQTVLDGGYLEGVSTGDDGWHAYCDEEGKLKGLPVNRRATELARHLNWPSGDVLCGPVIFLGDGKEGEEADVPEMVLNLALTLFGATNVRLVQ